MEAARPSEVYGVIFYKRVIFFFLNAMYVFYTILRNSLVVIIIYMYIDINLYRVNIIYLITLASYALTVTVKTIPIISINYYFFFNNVFITSIQCVLSQTRDTDTNRRQDSVPVICRCTSIVTKLSIPQHTLKIIFSALRYISTTAPPPSPPKNTVELGYVMKRTEYFVPL